MKNESPGNLLVNDVISAIRTVTGNLKTALHEPEFSGNEWKYTKECLDSGYVSSIGTFVNKFENDLANYTQSKHAIVVNNGTSALHIALMLAGVESGHEVLVPALTFVATANAVVYCGATPHFVDCEEESLGIDPVKLREYLKEKTEIRGGVCFNKKTKRVISALVPMHTFGHPSKINELLEICTEYKLVMVEDAAESIGSTYGGRHTGTFGLLGTISFNGNKTITTGGGGAILTNDGQLAKHAKHITTTARVPHLWSFVHDEVGFNYRMPNINAAIGCAQLEKIEDIIVKKRELHQRYLKAFESIPEVTVQRESKGSRSNFWLNSIKFGNNSKHVISTLLEQGNSEGLGLRPPWTLINKMTPYANYESMETHTASKIVETTVNIPSGPGLV